MIELLIFGVITFGAFIIFSMGYAVGYYKGGRYILSKWESSKVREARTIELELISNEE